MNPAFVYRQHGRSVFWIAFMSALAIHIGAVVLAKTKSPSAQLQDVSPLPDVEVVDTAEPEPALLEQSAPPPSLEELNIFSCFCCGDRLGSHCKEGADKQNAGAPKLGVRESFAKKPGRQCHGDRRAKELEALR